MSLEKAILHKKEHRKPYRHAKAFDVTCRNHGSDDWSRNGRTFSSKRRAPLITRTEKYFYGNIFKPPLTK